MKLVAAFAALALISTASAIAQDASVAVLELKPHTTNPLGYDKTDLTVKAGQKVKLTFNNNGSIAPQPHNFLLVKPGKEMAVGAQVNAMMTDPQGMAKSYIPEASKDDILAQMKLVMPTQTETIEFTAPADAGDYPFMCTFPGHWLLMKGTMHVTK
ncbi:MAG: plastocyanin/azurin family copper-binding protein [Prosthecobacter sp.]|nr:plastocyanin/azurin family copper-binding protein [Prosthecobacter sp.]